MPKTESERNAEWRERLLLRNEFFQDADQRRRDRLRGDILKDETPEAKALIAFFHAYPRCHTLPDSVGLDGSGWLVILDHYAMTFIEAAAAFVALSEITSIPVRVESYGDGSGGQWTDETLITQVRDEVAAMRRLGMWRPE